MSNLQLSDETQAVSNKKPKLDNSVLKLQFQHEKWGLFENYCRIAESSKIIALSTGNKQPNI